MTERLNWTELNWGFLCYIILNNIINNLLKFLQIIMKVEVLVVLLCPPLCDSIEPTRLFCSWNSPGKNTGVGCRFLSSWPGIVTRSPALQAVSLPSEPPGKHSLYSQKWEEGKLDREQRKTIVSSHGFHLSKLETFWSCILKFCDHISIFCASYLPMSKYIIKQG